MRSKNSATGIGGRPRWNRAVSPRPVPSTNRPPAISFTVAAAVASAAGWRVWTLVTPVANWMRSVPSATDANTTNGSGQRFCESVNVMPSHPAASARRARSTAPEMIGTDIVQSSTAPDRSGAVPQPEYRARSGRDGFATEVLDHFGFGRDVRRPPDRASSRTSRPPTAAIPPIRSDTRALECSPIQPTSGPPIGLEPMSAIENSDITRPRSLGSELSCSVAFDSEIIATLAAPTIGIIAYTNTMVGITDDEDHRRPESRGDEHQSTHGRRAGGGDHESADHRARAHQRRHRGEPARLRRRR